MTELQQVPHSREAEEALIGAVLINPQAIDVIDLEPSDFYIHRNGWVWKACQALRDKNEVIDFVTVTEMLDVMGHLAEIGGAAYITKLTNNVPSSLHADSYAKRVRDTSIRRQTLAKANELARVAYDETNDIVEERANIAVELAVTSNDDGAVPFGTWMADGYDYLEELSTKPREHAGLSTGLGDLDKVFGDGLLSGLNLLLGPPGVGKSILAQTIGLNFVDDNIPGVFYAGEMYWRDMYLRFMSSLTSQKVSDLRKGKVDFFKLTALIDETNDKPFWVDDPKRMKTPQLRADLTRLKAEYDIKWMVFDYLDDLKDFEGKVEGWRRSEILATRLQDMLVELDICGLVIHELTKEGYGKRTMGGMAGGKKVAYRAVSAVQLIDHLPKDGEPKKDFRSVMNIKPPRHVEGYKKICHLYKNPIYPRFELAAEDNDFVPHYSSDR